MSCQTLSLPDPNERPRYHYRCRPSYPTILAVIYSRQVLSYSPLMISVLWFLQIALDLFYCEGSQVKLGRARRRDGLLVQPLEVAKQADGEGGADAPDGDGHGRLDAAHVGGQDAL